MQLRLTDFISPELKTLNVTVPKLESTVALNLFLVKYGLDYNRLLFFKDIKSYIESYNKGVIALPNAYFFDENGNELVLDQEAVLNEDDAFAFVIQLRNCKLNKGKTLNDYLKYVDQSEEVSLNQNRYLVLITWAIYAGDINEAFAFKWAQLIDKAKEHGIDIECYLLNCDMLRHWDYSEFKNELTE